MNTVPQLHVRIGPVRFLLLVACLAGISPATAQTNTPRAGAQPEAAVGQALRAIYKDPTNGSNLVKSVAMIELAAESGIPLAQYDLAVCFDTGIGVPRDEKRALYFYERAAQNGLPVAQFELALTYLNPGQGIDRNPEKGVEWLQKAADAGFAQAQNQLGACYSMGTGVARNESTAFALYRKAADQNLPKALFNLGHCYLVGQGVKRDPAKAVDFMRRAADRGLFRAQMRLALLFHQGVEVPRDDERALEFVLRASRGNNPQVARLRNQITTDLTPAQIKSAREKYNAWLNP